MLLSSPAPVTFDRSAARAVVYGGSIPEALDIRTSIQHLPPINHALFGREAELARLEAAWFNPDTNFLQIVAPGGTGKSALMSNWYRHHLSEATMFGWSFYSQGTREKSEASSEPFFNEFLRWFDISVPPTESIFRKVDLLVDRLRRERVLLILDGVEPLQHPSGDLRDPALKGLLTELAARNPGLVLVTTRVRLTDISDDTRIDLENLSPADGALYLKHLGIQGTDDERRAASQAYGNHALALTLLGTYLKTFCQSDIRRRTDIKDLETDLLKPGRHAHKVMSSYARMYEGRPELNILRALGYFDRPAEPEALNLVLPETNPRDYQAALTTLHDARLILTNDRTKPIDCHPLIREHFATEASQDGHACLYEHYRKQAPQYPNTLEQMEPLFHAIYHGCQAGRHEECLVDVYRGRVLRGSEYYLNRKLGANAIDLSLLANFFETPWSQPAKTLSTADQAELIGDAGFNLRAVGRLAEAVEQMSASFAEEVKRGDCKGAANAASNLSQLHLTLGDVAEAITIARKSVAYADRSGNAFEKILSYTALADALNQSGDCAEALCWFGDAELIQVEREPQHPLLYSVQGYGYCDLLLVQGKTAEVLVRASQTLLWAEKLNWLLSIGHDHLSLGRAHPVGSPESRHHLDDAVDYIRSSGFLEFLPRALLARGRPDDIEEAYRISSRCGMGLYLRDSRLASLKKGSRNRL